MAALRLFLGSIFSRWSGNSTSRIKSLAVSLPVTDTQKLEAIQKYTGFNAAAAIRHNKEEQMAEENPEIDTPQRVRRAEPKYKIVNN